MASDRDREMAREWLSDGHGDCYRYEPREDEAGETVDSLAALIARAREEGRRVGYEQAEFKFQKSYERGYKDGHKEGSEEGRREERERCCQIISAMAEEIKHTSHRDGLGMGDKTTEWKLRLLIDRISPAAIREGREPTKSGGRE